MKKLLAVAMAVILGINGTSAWALSQEECEDISVLAQKAMEYRQEGTSLAQAQKELNNIFNNNEDIQEILSFVLQVAYSQKVEKSQSEKKTIIQKTGRDFYEICMGIGDN